MENNKNKWRRHIALTSIIGIVGIIGIVTLLAPKPKTDSEPDTLVLQEGYVLGGQFDGDAVIERLKEQPGFDGSQYYRSEMHNTPARRLRVWIEESNHLKVSKSIDFFSINEGDDGALLVGVKETYYFSTKENCMDAFPEAKRYFSNGWLAEFRKHPNYEKYWLFSNSHESNNFEMRLYERCKDASVGSDNYIVIYSAISGEYMAKINHRAIEGVFVPSRDPEKNSNAVVAQ
jgi:hypothetical protein